jgi:hypothetical protein
MTRLIFLSLTIPLSPCAHRFLSLQSRCRENSLRPHRTPHQYKLRKSPIKVANYDPSRAASTAGPLHPPSLPALSLSRRVSICLPAHASSCHWPPPQSWPSDRPLPNSLSNPRCLLRSPMVTLAYETSRLPMLSPFDLRILH